MTRQIAPSAQQAQELAQGFEGQPDTPRGEALLSALVRLSTERVLQEALAYEQAAALGRSRYERQPCLPAIAMGMKRARCKLLRGGPVPTAPSPWASRTVSLQTVGCPGPDACCAAPADRREVCGRDVATGQ
jgi:hypothetical protein